MIIIRGRRWPLGINFNIKKEFGNIANALHNIDKSFWNIWINCPRLVVNVVMRYESLSIVAMHCNAFKMGWNAFQRYFH